MAIKLLEANFYKNGKWLDSNFYSYIKRNRSHEDVKEMLAFEGSTKREKYENWIKAKRHLADDSIQGLKTDLNESSLSKLKNGESISVSRSIDYESNTATSEVIIGKNVTDEIELLKLHKFDIDKWSVKSAQSSSWDCGSRRLTASKIKVAPRSAGNLTDEQIFKKFDKLAGYKAGMIPKVLNASRESLLVIPISDLHLGLLAEMNTTGNEYNLEIGERRVKHFIGSVIEESKDIDRVLVTFGNDYFNSDNVFGTTTKGTRQDNEKSYFSVFDKGVEIAIDIIETLARSFKTVEVASVQGNHDKQSSHAMTTALYYKYHNSKNVYVYADSDEKARFYYKFGQNLIGFGHETKIKECHRIMSTECKEWSECKYKTFFLGHLHHEEVYDTGSVVARRLPILSGRSEWSSECGFAADPRAQAFVFSYNNGLTKILNITEV